jgi:hypothetical protein
MTNAATTGPGGGCCAAQLAGAAATHLAQQRSKLAAAGLHLPCSRQLRLDTWCVYMRPFVCLCGLCMCTRAVSVQSTAATAPHAQLSSSEA